MTVLPDLIQRYLDMREARRQQQQQQPQQQPSQDMPAPAGAFRAKSHGHCAVSMGILSLLSMHHGDGRDVRGEGRQQQRTQTSGSNAPKPPTPPPKRSQPPGMHTCHVFMECHASCFVPGAVPASCRGRSPGVGLLHSERLYPRCCLSVARSTSQGRSPTGDPRPAPSPEAPYIYMYIYVYTYICSASECLSQRRVFFLMGMQPPCGGQPVAIKAAPAPHPHAGSIAVFELQPQVKNESLGTLLSPWVFSPDLRSHCKVQSCHRQGLGRFREKLFPCTNVPSLLCL